MRKSMTVLAFIAAGLVGLGCGAGASGDTATDTATDTGNRQRR